MQKTPATSTHLLLSCFLMIVAWLSIPSAGIAQAIPAFKGVVIDNANNLPLPNITVTLTALKDTVILRLQRTGNNGAFSITPPDNGKYLLHFSAPDFTTITHPADASITGKYITLRLTRKPKELRQVTIQGKKPVITFQGEKMMANIENLEGVQTSNAFEILHVLPGVVIENDESLKLNGQSDITLLLNGRKQTLTVSQAIRLLKSMPASNIKLIEIYNGKSVRFDASGSGGVLNIITKTAGNDLYNVSIGNTLYVDKEVASAHNVFTNIKSGRIQTSFSASLSNRFRYSENQTLGEYTNARLSKVADSFYNRSRTFAPGIYWSLDYTLKKDQTIGFIVSSYFDNNDNSIHKTSDVKPQSAPYSIQFNQQGKIKENLTSVDLIYNYQLDTLYSRLIIDLGYITGYSRDRPFFNNRYMDDANNELRPTTYMQANIPLQGHQYIVQADLEKNLNKKSSFLAGIKYTSSSINNYVNYDTLRNGISIPDTRRTDSLAYYEQIAAAYVSYRRTFNRFSMQAGMRIEYTLMKNESLSADSMFSRNYFNAFPNLVLSYNGKKIRNSLVFSTSITRPGYQQLNPYIKYLDEMNYQVGNADLRPGYSFNINSNTSFDNTVYFTAGYSYGKNIVSNVSRQQADTIITIIRPYNALSYHILYGNLSGSYEFFGVWSGNLNISGNMVRYKVGKEYKTSNMDEDWLAMLTISNSNSLKLARDLYFEEGFYFYSGRRFFQNRLEPRWQMSTGLRYKMFKGKLSLAANVSDIFKTMQNKGNTFYDGYNSTYHSRYNSRRFRLAATISFGELKKDLSKTGSTKKEAERFKSGQE